MEENPIRPSMKRLYAKLLISCFCLLAILTTAYADFLEPGEPPVFPENVSDLVILESPQPMGPILSGISIDPMSRGASRDFFNTYYKASEGHAIGWTGNHACDAGETAGDFRDAVLLRLNYFRAMAGVPSETVLSDVYTSKAQEAALMMSVNNSLSHYPTPAWQCYSDNGAEAAANSNLYLGVFGWNAITGYMKDSGSNNYFVGHRRWILYPQTQTMGTGDIPFVSSYPSSNALWVFDSNIFGPRPSTREEFVSWPPPGYVPYQVVFPRWSFSYPSADFSAATVTMTSEGANIWVDLAAVANGYGENTIVWIPMHLNDGDVWPKPNTDTTFSVVIANVLIGSASNEFQYAVTVFDPDIETMPPSVSITSHIDGQHVNTSSITLAGTASDSGEGDNGIQQVTVNGSRANNDMAVGNATANWSKVVSLNPGANTITVIAYDDSSNHNQTSHTKLHS